jgi:hypothetical protein
VDTPAYASIDDRRSRLLLNPLFAITVPYVAGLIDHAAHSTAGLIASYLWFLVMSATVLEVTRRLYFKRVRFATWLSKPRDRVAALAMAPLVEELELLQAFVALHEWRSPGAVRVHALLDAADGVTIPPMVLPELLENAVKHNAASVTRPLDVTLRRDGHALVVFDELIELRNAGYPLLGDERQFQRFWDYLADPPLEDDRRHLDLGGEKRNCDIGLRSMFIYPNGDVFFCDFLKQPIGNIYKNSLEEIYRGDTADAQRDRMITCNVDCQQTCKRPIPLMEKARTFLRMG